MTEENIQAHLNDCSQHSSKFICRECGMVSENFTICKKLYCSQHSSEFICREREFLVAHTLLFYNLKKHYSYCFFRSMKHLTQAFHPYLQRVQRETTKMMRNDGGNRQEN